MESRVEVFAQIRRGARVEGLSIRELARRHGVGRPTVRQALVQAEHADDPSPALPLLTKWIVVTRTLSA